MQSTRIPKKVIKRDGTIVPFNQEKIKNAVARAAAETICDRKRIATISQRITDAVIEALIPLAKRTIPSIESIQDTIETVLMNAGYSHIAKSYILYREKHTEARMAKSLLGLKDDLKLPINTIEVLKRRYLLKDENKNIIETPSELLRRVAYHASQAERHFKSTCAPEEVEDSFYHMMRSLEFMPNSPTLMNAGTKLGQLSACFVIPINDSMEGIFTALKHMAIIHQTGGGTGFSFSSLRPKGDLVNSTRGEASGPVSFMSIFNKATEIIVQGGKRRGANMGILRCDHPDIIDFIEAKADKECFSDFNLSVGQRPFLISLSTLPGEPVTRGSSF